MTQKVYKTSRGKAVDIGALRLQNEHVRAVGNMNVNARGDRIDGQGNIIDTRTEQYTRSIGRTSSPTNDIVHSSSAAAKRAKDQATAKAPTPDPIPPVEVDPLEEFDDVAANTVAPAEVSQLEPEVALAPEVLPEPIAAPAPVTEDPIAAPEGGGLAAAIARAKTVKQELEKTAREQAKTNPVKKI